MPTELVLPLAQEHATVTKEVIETGRVRFSTHVEERRELIHEMLRHQDVVVERVEIGRPVEETPEVRVEGDVIVYPIVEEVLVVEKRLVLKQELRISRRTRTEEVEREITLRTVRADIERTSEDQS